MRSVNRSRRKLALLLPALAAAQANPAGDLLPSRTYRFEDLPVRTSGRNRSRAVLNGKTRSGFAVQLHQTELAPGEMPHAAHRHLHEEAIFLREGTLEVTISGQSSRLGPGSVAFVASNEEHGWRNVGTTPAHYFVLALGRDS